MQQLEFDFENREKDDLRGHLRDEWMSMTSADLVARVVRNSESPTKMNRFFDAVWQRWDSVFEEGRSRPMHRNRDAYLEHLSHDDHARLVELLLAYKFDHPDSLPAAERMADQALARHVKESRREIDAALGNVQGNRTEPALS